MCSHNGWRLGWRLAESKQTQQDAKGTIKMQREQVIDEKEWKIRVNEIFIV